MHGHGNSGRNQWEGKVDERDVGRVLGQEHVEDIQKDRQVDENGDRRPCEADFQARYQPGLPNIPKEKQRRRHGTGDAGHRDQAFEQRAIALPDAEQDESDQERHQPQDESVTGNPFPAHVILRRVPAINLVEAYRTTLSCIKFGGLQGCLQVARGYARPLASKGRRHGQALEYEAMVTPTVARDERKAKRIAGRKL